MVFVALLLVTMTLASEGIHTQDKFVIAPGGNFTWNITYGKGFKLNENIMLPKGISLITNVSEDCNNTDFCLLNFTTDPNEIQEGVYSITVLAYHKDKKGIQNIKAFTASIIVSSFWNLSEVNKTLTNILANITQLQLKLETYYTKAEINETISNIINQLNSLKSYIQANEDRWLRDISGVSLAEVRSEIDKAVEILIDVMAEKTTVERTMSKLNELENKVENIKSSLEAVEFSLKCGNDICEEGENYENCPQDCLPKIVATPKEEGLMKTVGYFILANSPSILSVLILSILLWFYFKKFKTK